MKKLISIFITICSLTYGALPTTMVWEQRPTVGSDTNGGGFDFTAAGTDMSQFNNKNAAACSNCQSATVNISTTNAVAIGTTTITSITANFSSAITGNAVFFSGGTGSIASQWRTATFVSSTSITIDTAIAASTGMTMNIGGALSTIGQLNTNMALSASSQGWIKATGTITTTSSIQIGNTFTGANNALPVVSGYTTTRGDSGYVTIQATAGLGGSPVLALGGQNNGMTVQNFKVDCNSQTNTLGVNYAASAFGTMANIVVSNCTAGYGFQLANVDITCRRCYVTGQSAGNPFIFTGNRQLLCYICVAYSNSTSSAIFVMSNAEGYCNTCIAANNNGISADGFVFGPNSGSALLSNCVSYKNGRDGLRTQIGTMTVMTQNCIFYGNSGFGINCNGCTNNQQGGNLDYNAYGGNSSGNLNLIPAGTHDVTLVVDPFVNGGSNNFQLSAAGIAALGSKGFPGDLFVGGSGKLAIGALQPAGGNVAPYTYPIH